MRTYTARIFAIALVLVLLISACKPASTGTIKGQTIEVLLPPWAQIPQEMLDQFTSESGVKVNQTIAEWDAIRDKISVAGAAGSELADVAEFDWSWTGQFAQSGWFVPLETVFSQDLINDLQNKAAFTANGHLYAIPYSNDFRISAYNTKMFTDAGISTPPKTFDELKADLKLLKDSGIEYPLGLFMAPNENTSTTWYLMTLAMGGAVAARALFYNPRPFVLGLGRMLIEHEATSSFPSLHATFLFSLALPLLVMHGSRSIGLMVFVSGITVAWARIFVGVHYPFDMAGAVVTAAMATAVACAAVKRARPPRIVYLQR